jgi:hypothetical protein
MHDLLKGSDILPRQVKMNSLRRLLTNVPVLLLLAAAPVFAVDLPAVGPPFAASPGTALALPPGVTPQQAEAVRQAIQSG